MTHSGPVRITLTTVTAYCRHGDRRCEHYRHDGKIYAWCGHTGPFEKFIGTITDVAEVVAPAWCPMRDTKP